jgi:hypothetical protein
MGPNKRKADRVMFQRAQPVRIMAVDGTWQRSCVLRDASSTGARIEVSGTTDVLRAKEFFLVLSSTGLAFRRCELVWIDGTIAGVRYLVSKPEKKKPQRSA